jgi:hypothetical protein
MKTKLIAALLVAASASIAAPAFASGYGPAPFYRPNVGAPLRSKARAPRPWRPNVPSNKVLIRRTAVWQVQRPSRALTTRNRRARSKSTSATKSSTESR